MTMIEIMADFKELVELIGKVSLRPAMYAGEYDFYRAAAFIEGFVYARRRSGILEESEALKDFSRWLSEKLDRPSNWAWFAILKDYIETTKRPFPCCQHFSTNFWKLDYENGPLKLTPL